MSCYLKTCLSQFLLLVALAVPLFAAGCDRDSDPPIEPQVRGASPIASAQAAEAGASGGVPELNMTDPAITARVKTALLADEEVKGLKIDVDTDEGRVTLKGVLSNDSQVKRAVEVTRGVDGVREVVNRLTVNAEDKAARSSRG